MKCPFRVGVIFDYELAGPTHGTKTADNYIEKGQHAIFEDCYEDECPYYTYYDRKCERTENE